MIKNYFLALAALACFATPTFGQFLDVVSAETPPYNVAADLIRDHLTGPGIEILNVEFTGNPTAVGYFTGGSQSVGLERGLIMSTGRVSTLGPENGAQEVGSDFASTVNGISEIDPYLDVVATGAMNDLVRYRI